MPLGESRLEAQGLERDANLDAPARCAPRGRRFPDAVPVRVLGSAIRIDQRIVTRTTWVHRKDVTGSTIEERSQHNPHVVLGGERRIASDAETYDPRRVGVVTDDTDDERLGTRKDFDDGPARWRGAFGWVGLRERI